MSSQPYFYLHVAVILALVGLVAAAIGCYIGWLLWRGCKSDAQRLQEENKLLREEFAKTEATHLELRSMLGN